MAVAMERVSRRTNYAVAKKCRRWNLATKASRNGLDQRLDDGAPAARENLAARAGLEISVVVIADILAPVSEVVAVAAPADVQLLEVTARVESRRQAGGEGTFKEKKVEGVEVGPSAGG